MKRFVLPRVRPPAARSGFTLLEIMLVVSIIAVLLAASIKLMLPNIGAAKGVRVDADLQNIATQLRLYEALSGGSPPTTEQGLQALVTEPQSEPKPSSWRQLMTDVPKDPWGQPYVYICPGKKNPLSFDLYSKGPDRQADTADDIYYKTGQ